MRTIPLSEFLEILKGQGVPRNHLAFRCPLCGTIQSMQSLMNAGVTSEKVDDYIGFSCVGRFTHMQVPPKEKGTQDGCNWTLGGLFSMHDLEVETEDGKKHPRFEPATPEEAKSLMAKFEEVTA